MTCGNKPGKGKNIGKEQAVLVAVTLWRLLLSALSGYASWLMLANRPWHAFVDQLVYFTTLSTLAVFLVNTGSVLRPFVFRKRSIRYRIEGTTAWFRAVATCMTVFTGIIFATLLGANYPDTSGKLAHIVVPLAMLIDWLFVGRNNQGLHWLFPLSWAAAILPYFWIYVWDWQKDGGTQMYGFLDPGAANWWTWVAIVIAVFIALAYLLRWMAFAIRRRRA